MAKLSELKDRETGEVFYPVTSARAVFSDAGLNMHDELDRAKLQLFIEMFNEAAAGYGHAGFDENGEFDATLNGITGIKLPEALRIYSLYPLCQSCGPSENKFAGINGIRTLMPVALPAQGHMVTYKAAFADCKDLEVIRFAGPSDQTLQSAQQTFEYCPKLRCIHGRFQIWSTSLYAFRGCPELTDISIYNLKVNLDFSACPRLSFYSVNYMATYSDSSYTKTVTVHPDVFAKITGDTSNEAAAALSAEELQQWMELIELAASKNVSFTTN